MYKQAHGPCRYVLRAHIVGLILCMIHSAIHYLKKVNLDDYANLFATVVIQSDLAL
jgi:hypothetical protein